MAGRSQTPQNRNFVEAHTRKPDQGTRVRRWQPGNICTNCERNKINIGFVELGGIASQYRVTTGGGGLHSRAQKKPPGQNDQAAFSHPWTPHEGRPPKERNGLRTSRIARTRAKVKGRLTIYGLFTAPETRHQAARAARRGPATGARKARPRAGRSPNRLRAPGSPQRGRPGGGRQGRTPPTRNVQRAWAQRKSGLRRERSRARARSKPKQRGPRTPPPEEPPAGGTPAGGTPAGGSKRPQAAARSKKAPGAKGHNKRPLRAAQAPGAGAAAPRAEAPEGTPEAAIGGRPRGGPGGGTRQPKGRAGDEARATPRKGARSEATGRPGQRTQREADGAGVGAPAKERPSVGAGGEGPRGANSGGAAAPERTRPGEGAPGQQGTRSAQKGARRPMTTTRQRPRTAGPQAATTTEGLGPTEEAPGGQGSPRGFMPRGAGAPGRSHAEVTAAAGIEGGCPVYRAAQIPRRGLSRCAPALQFRILDTRTLFRQRALADYG